MQRNSKKQPLEKMPDQISHANRLNNFHKSAVMATDVTHTKKGGEGGRVKSHSAQLPRSENKVHDHLGVVCALPGGSAEELRSPPLHSKGKLGVTGSSRNRDVAHHDKNASPVIVDNLLFIENFQTPQLPKNQAGSKQFEMQKVHSVLMFKHSQVTHYSNVKWTVMDK